VCPGIPALCHAPFFKLDGMGSMPQLSAPGFQIGMWHAGDVRSERRFHARLVSVESKPIRRVLEYLPVPMLGMHE
jgi:hypothetical protein